MVVLNDTQIAGVLDILASRPGIWEQVPETPGLSEEERIEAVNELSKRGWVDVGSPLRGDGRLMFARKISVTMDGRSALKELRRKMASDASDRSQPVSLEEKRRRRAMFMNALYDDTDGREIEFVESPVLGARFGWSEDETYAIVDYLEGEGLLQYRATGGLISITHYGVVEVESGRTSPSEPTEHFVPFNLIQIAGDVVQSQIQSGSIGSSQTQSYLTVEEQQVALQFVEEFRRQIPNLPFEQLVKAEVEADLTTAEAQLHSPRPKVLILREALHSLRAVAEGLAASGAFLGLIELAKRIH